MERIKGIMRLRYLVLSLFMQYSFISIGQSDSLQRCKEYLDRAQVLFGANNWSESELSALAGWELSQKMGQEELMSRACFWLSENARKLGKETEAYEFAVRGRYLGERSSDTYFVACHLALLRVLYEQELWGMINEISDGDKIPNFVSLEDKCEMVYLRSNALLHSSQAKQSLKIIQDFRSTYSANLTKQSMWEERLLSLAVESAVIGKFWKEAEELCRALMSGYYEKVDKVKRIQWNGWLSQIYLQKKDYKSAISLYNKSLLLCSDADYKYRLPLLINLAESYYLGDNLVIAEQYLEQALAISEQYASYYYQSL